MSKHATKSIQQFGILSSLPAVKVSQFNKFILPIKGLLQLELSKFSQGLGETGLNRLLMGCRSTLEYISLPYNSPSVSEMTLSTVGTMDKLTTIHLGTPSTLFKISDKLRGLSLMFKAIKQKSAMRLKILSIYECDIKLLKLIRDSQADNLERLSIAYWHQPGSTLFAEEDNRLKDEDLNQIQMCLGGVRTQLT